MQPYQQRVIEEKAELDARLEKLEAFLDGEICGRLPYAERRRLCRQANAMHQYSGVLGERIAAFTE